MRYKFHLIRNKTDLKGHPCYLWYILKSHSSSKDRLAQLWTLLETNNTSLTDRIGGEKFTNFFFASNPIYDFEASSMKELQAKISETVDGIRYTL